jgi:hypothetical protein
MTIREKDKKSIRETGKNIKRNWKKWDKVAERKDTPEEWRRRKLSAELMRRIEGTYTDLLERAKEIDEEVFKETDERVKTANEERGKNANEIAAATNASATKQEKKDEETNGGAGIVEGLRKIIENGKTDDDVPLPDWLNGSTEQTKDTPKSEFENPEEETGEQLTENEKFLANIFNAYISELIKDDKRENEATWIIDDMISLIDKKTLAKLTQLFGKDAMELFLSRGERAKITGKLSTLIAKMRKELQASGNTQEADRLKNSIEESIRPDKKELFEKQLKNREERT